MKTAMRILLIGPRPPPHGGISVHVFGLHRQLKAAGMKCDVLDTSQIDSRLRFAMKLARYAATGWTLHLHTNGHNRNSWLLALLCGVMGQGSAGCILTLHSGMMPGYVRTGSVWHRKLAAFVCRLYSRIICVGPELRDAVISLGTPLERTEIAPACLPPVSSDAVLDPQLEAWITRHRPLLSTALFFRPEYGFELLVDAIAQLRQRYPDVGCLVMGSGEQSAQAAERVRKARLEQHMLLLGDVDHSTCLALMSLSNVFVRPTFEDGDSMSVREALTLGIPVVASRVGSRPANTILFDPGDVEDLLSKLEFAIGHRRRAA
jgi:glycosyltransferase involved in cell wall biosynthesis